MLPKPLKSPNQPLPLSRHEPNARVRNKVARSATPCRNDERHRQDGDRRRRSRPSADPAAAARRRRRRRTRVGARVWVSWQVSDPNSVKLTRYCSREAAGPDTFLDAADFTEVQTRHPRPAPVDELTSAKPSAAKLVGMNNTPPRSPRPSARTQRRAGERAPRRRRNDRALGAAGIHARREHRSVGSRANPVNVPPASTSGIDQVAPPSLVTASASNGFGPAAAT